MNTSDRLPILIDLKKNRIRIHRKTLHALGSPSHVILIINPVRRVIGIKCASSKDRSSHRIPKNLMHGKTCVELWSKPFITALLRICPDWNSSSCYRMEGRLIPDMHMAYFNMDTAVKIQETEGET